MKTPRLALVLTILNLGFLVFLLWQVRSMAAPAVPHGPARAAVGTRGQSRRGSVPPECGDRPG